MIFAVALSFLVLVPLSVIWRGYVLTILWEWFVVPTFGSQHLALAPAIGVSLLVSYLTHQFDAAKEPDGNLSERMWRAYSYAALLPLFALGTGWVVRHFM